MTLPKPGDAAPDFTAQNDRRQTVKLGDQRGHWVVLFFYPRDDTPG